MPRAASALHAMSSGVHRPRDIISRLEIEEQLEFESSRRRGRMISRFRDSKIFRDFEISRLEDMIDSSNLLKSFACHTESERYSRKRRKQCTDYSSAVKQGDCRTLHPYCSLVLLLILSSSISSSTDDSFRLPSAGQTGGIIRRPRRSRAAPASMRSASSSRLTRRRRRPGSETEVAPRRRRQEVLRRAPWAHRRASRE
jgi:hypothetical protein